MRPSPVSCRTQNETDRSGAPRFACLEPCASLVQPVPPLLPRSAEGAAALRNALRSAEYAVSLFPRLGVRTVAFAEVFGTTTARSNPGNRWCRIHGHRPP